MGNTALSEMQLRLLEMFRWFHGFCEENGLRYYMLGGTMLGAVRHGGFIPWDDDIDVGMPRSDYEKLKKLFPDDGAGIYELETPESPAKEYCYPICKIYDTRTTLIENKRYPVKRGLFIDVFPLDGLCDSERQCAEAYAPIKRKYNLLLTKVCGIRKGRSFYKNAAVCLIRMLPDFMLNEKKLIKEIDDMCSRRDFDECAWGGNFLGAWGIKEIMPRSIMGTPVLYRFEDMQAYGAEDYDGYLTHLYNDWRKLPPAEKQVTHHDFAELDLARPYKDK